MKRTYKEVREEILNDPSTHRWLVDNLRNLEHRDCVDAYHDALTFAKLAKMRMDEAINDYIDETLRKAAV